MKNELPLLCPSFIQKKCSVQCKTCQSRINVPDVLFLAGFIIFSMTRKVSNRVTLSIKLPHLYSSVIEVILSYTRSKTGPFSGRVTTIFVFHSITTTPDHYISIRDFTVEGKDIHPKMMSAM